MDPRREAFGYHPLIHVLLMGVCGAFLTGDLFNLYVWFEVMLIASFVLMALHRTRAAAAGGVNYVTLNLLASAVLLTAIGLLYGHAGTLNMADLARAWAGRDARRCSTTALAMLFLTAFGIKAGLFPLFFWLPASYHTPPAAIGALFAGLLTKVGVYAMIRVFSLIFRIPDAPGVHASLLVLSIATMVVGLVGAIAQRDLRRVLSFNLVGHIGFTTVGLALWTPLALGASILYLLHHILVITTLFLVSGLFLRQRPHHRPRRAGRALPLEPGALAALILVPLFSLAGTPPLSGFVAKLAIVEAALAGALTTCSPRSRSSSGCSPCCRWRVSGSRSPGRLRRPPTRVRSSCATLAPVAGLVVVTLGLTVAAGPVFDASVRAAEQLLDPTHYIQAVLGGR